MSLAQGRTEEVYVQVLIKNLNLISVGVFVLNIGFNPVAVDFFATSLVGVFSFMLGGLLFMFESKSTNVRHSMVEALFHHLFAHLFLGIVPCPGICK